MSPTSIRRHLAGLGVVALLLPALPAIAGCSAHSGATTHAAITLFTSEGCDSCPPADFWLSHWRSAARKDVVPMAFHVDYWDRLGWRDPYGSAAFSRRQRELATAAGQRMVYTPQVLLQGRDFRDWRDEAAVQRRLSEILQSPAQADIRLHIDPVEARQWRVNARFQQRSGGRAVAYVALLQHRLTSNVGSGENRGKQLTHDYVVRQWWGPLELPDNRLSWSQTVEVADQALRGGMSLGAWVENPATGEVLQALALAGCWP